MAIVTGVGAGNMSRSLTTCSCAVMAVETCPVDCGVIDLNRRRPYRCGMTIIANVRGIDVSRRFTRGRGAVMATAARPRHTAMVKNRRKPASR